MSVSTSRRTPEAAGGDRGGTLAHLNAALEHASHLLPAQGPITVFIHHNTLHGFEDDSFHDALKEGTRIFGSQPRALKVE